MLDRAVILRKKAGRRRLLSLCALIAIAALFALIIANGFRVTEQRREAERWQRHSLEVLLVTGRLETAVNEAMRGERGYLITNDREFLPPYFRGRTQSQLLLRRLVRNLLENAQRYAGIGPILISVNPQADRAVLDVVDHGPGVPESERERIFEPFYRLPQSRETGRGSGLGLALVRQIARRHGGDAVCLAADGVGSRFRIDLPVA